METMLAGCMCGLLWHTLSGQPLCIVGATGPLLIFEGILYVVCKFGKQYLNSHDPEWCTEVFRVFFRDYGLDFLTFRFWTGAWICAILILLVAADFSATVAYITRFTEESFSVLISLIFIMEAFKVTKLHEYIDLRWLLMWFVYVQKLFAIWYTHPIHVHASEHADTMRCHCQHPEAGKYMHI